MAEPLVYFWINLKHCIISKMRIFLNYIFTSHDYSLNFIFRQDFRHFLYTMNFHYIWQNQLIVTTIFTMLTAISYYLELTLWVKKKKSFAFNTRLLGFNSSDLSIIMTGEEVTRLCLKPVLMVVPMTTGKEGQLCMWPTHGFSQCICAS